jgi:DNA-binding XRE family transcriptional regulator
MAVAKNFGSNFRIGFRPLLPTWYTSSSTNRKGVVMTFGKLLQSLRVRASLTQERLAQASGLSIGIVRDYEQGKKEPSMRSAFKLAEALGVSVEVFKDCASADQAVVPAEAPGRPARASGNGKAGDGSTKGTKRSKGKGMRREG